ncbi:GTP cyclohydrolase 1 type 2 homolog YbgI [hydrothermal vent metagenome]|uniref:GTP cyclohydrolase 1 type 2 homolog YbgI n=1 Tax=hydrothermal vent metagenome TaxID=652676 RepID=A0A3B0YCU4_9ZZZZ
MANRDELVQYCDRLLDVGNFRDYCPNGLQVEGCDEVTRIVSGVTASQPLIEAAVAQQADLLLVHHGYFWKGEDACITGIKRRRLKALLDQDMNLLAYHLPLDAHPVLGNNACLAERLGVEITDWFGDGEGPALACEAVIDPPLTGVQLGRQIGQALFREALHIEAGPAQIRRIGWCSGAAQGCLETAARRGLDAFISGEISESTVHIAREYGIHYFAAGHHASERYGVQALGEHLAGHFGVEHFFVNIDNPV